MSMIDSKAAIEAVKGATNILPEAGKVEVLAHLLSTLNTETLKALSPKARSKLQAVLALDAPAAAVTVVSDEVKKTSLMVGEEMVASYTYDKKAGVSVFTIPAGVQDIEAMKAVNSYFTRHLPELNRDAIYAGNYDWYEQSQVRRDTSLAREVRVTAAVKGTVGKARALQGTVLAEHGLSFSDVRDLALAAALHACNNNGADLFQDKWARGSLPGCALGTIHDYGVRVQGYDDGLGRYVVAAGSPAT